MAYLQDLTWILFLLTLNATGFSYPIPISSDTHCSSGVYNCMSKANSVCRSSKIINELLRFFCQCRKTVSAFATQRQSQVKAVTDSMGRNGKCGRKKQKNLDCLSRSNFPGPLLSCCLAVADVIALREEMEVLEHFLLLP